MKLKTLQRAKAEAIRFMAFAGQAEKNFGEYGEGKHNAAAKRASMDLARVLANLRQGR